MGGLKGHRTRLYLGEESTYKTAVLVDRPQDFLEFALSPQADSLMDESQTGRRSPVGVQSGISKFGPGALRHELAYEDSLWTAGMSGSAAATAGSDPYVHTYTPSEPSKSFTIVAELIAEAGGTNRRLEYAGSCITGWNLSIEIGQKVLAELEVVAAALDIASSVNTAAALGDAHKETVTGLTGGANNADTAVEVPYRPGTLQIASTETPSLWTKLAIGSTPSSEKEFCENSDGTFDVYQPAADTDVAISYEIDRNPIVALPSNTTISLADLSDAIVGGDAIGCLSVELAGGGNQATEDWSSTGLEQPCDDGLLESIVTFRLARVTAAQSASWRSWQENATELQAKILIDDSSNNRSLEIRIARIVVTELTSNEETPDGALKRPELVCRVLPALGKNPTWPTYVDQDIVVLVENALPAAFMI